MDRVKRLAKAVTEAGAGAIVVQNRVALDYLTGFGEDGHERFLALLVAADGSTELIAPALSVEQARRAGLRDVQGWVDGEDAMNLVAATAERQGWKGKTVLVDDDLKAAHLLRMQEALPTTSFKRGGPTLMGVMRTKDEAEIELMKRAAKIADDAWEAVAPQIKAGASERQVAKLLSEAMESRGGRTTFTIIAAGAGGAEPHHMTDDTVLKTGDVVVCDFGCEVEGYQSDITRMISIGAPKDPDASKVYDVVLRAHHAAREFVRPGHSRTEVDTAARKVIEEAGYGDKFPHRLGHGIGRFGHEEPYLTPGDSSPLQVGDCFSIEPGIYLPGRFGIRIENIVVLREHGCESLNNEPEATLRTG